MVDDDNDTRAELRRRELLTLLLLLLDVDAMLLACCCWSELALLSSGWPLSMGVTWMTEDKQRRVYSLLCVCCGRCPSSLSSMQLMQIQPVAVVVLVAVAWFSSPQAGRACSRAVVWVRWNTMAILCRLQHSTTLLYS